MSELKTIFTDDASKIKNKAITDVSMLLTWVIKDDLGRDSYNQAILPLCDWHMIHDDLKTTFRLDLARSVLPLPAKMIHFFVCVCDDPEQEWTGDWAHLGAFRIRAIFHNCVMADDSDLIEITCARTDCETDIFEVQNGFRTVSDQYVSLLRSPNYAGKVVPGMFR